MATFNDTSSSRRETENERINRVLVELRAGPQGFGSPEAIPASAHGVLPSGWMPNPDIPSSRPVWFYVDCCKRWPAHNESYLNMLCGHRVHEGCVRSLRYAYTLEGCPVCYKNSLAHERQCE